MKEMYSTMNFVDYIMGRIKSEYKNDGTRVTITDAISTLQRILDAWFGDEHRRQKGCVFRHEHRFNELMLTPNRVICLVTHCSMHKLKSTICAVSSCVVISRWSHRVASRVRYGDDQSSSWSSEVMNIKQQHNQRRCHGIVFRKGSWWHTCLYSRQ